MISLPNRAVVAVTALAVAAGTALASAPAQADTVTQVRPADAITIPGAPSGTTGTAKAQFLAEGIHVKTDNGTDAARLYYKLPTAVPFSQLTQVSYEWFGTPAAQPAQAYNIDLNGDGKPDGQLLGEAAYGGHEVWLNKDSSDFTESGLPAGTMAALAPCNLGVARPGISDGCAPSMGTGGDFHGSLSDWNKRFAAAGKTATVVSSGFIAVGLTYDGVLRSQNVGANQYTFTSTAKSAVTVAAAAKKATVHKSNKIKISGTAKPVGAGATVALELKKNGKWTTVVSRTLASTGTFRFGTKPAKLGTNRLRVTVTETNSTLAAKSATVKVKVIK
jgi:hypothetical protein